MSWLKKYDYSVSLVECEAPLSTVSLEGQVLDATPAALSRFCEECIAGMCEAAPVVFHWDCDDTLSVGPPAKYLSEEEAGRASQS